MSDDLQHFFGISILYRFIWDNVFYSTFPITPPACGEFGTRSSVLVTQPATKPSFHPDPHSLIDACFWQATSDAAVILDNLQKLMRFVMC